MSGKNVWIQICTLSVIMHWHDCIDVDYCTIINGVIMKMDYGEIADNLAYVNARRIGYCALCFASIYDDEARFETEKGFMYCEKCYKSLKENDNA